MTKFAVNILWFKRMASGRDSYGNTLTIVNAQSEEAAVGGAVLDHNPGMGKNIECIQCLEIEKEEK